MAFHVVIICLKELSEVLHSQLYSFVPLLLHPMCFMFSDVTLHSLPIKVVTVDREVDMHFSKLLVVHWSSGNLTLFYTY
jgi:hypothetical protein